MITGFYHIAAMNHWREVVMEQMRQLSRVFRGPLRIGLIADEWEDGYVHGVMRAFGIDYEMVHYQAGLEQFEYPTLSALEAHCRQRAQPGERVFYLHTKAVSTPATWKRQQWRWLMNAALCQHLVALPPVDLCGANWVDGWCPAFPHMEGNFWLARADYIARLPALARFRSTFQLDPRAPNWEPNMDRYGAELWVGQGKPTVTSWFHNHGLWTDEFWTARMKLCERLMQIHAA